MDGTLRAHQVLAPMDLKIKAPLPGRVNRMMPVKKNKTTFDV